MFQVKKITRIGCLALLLFGFNGLYAQDARQQLIDDAALEYLQIAANQSVIYYSVEQEWHPRATNHPYMRDDQYVKGRLSHLHVIYPEAMLRFDLYRNELLVQSPLLRNFVLFPENVDFAELHGYHLIYFRADSLPGCPSSGYYLLLHSGNCKVLEKQIAVLMQDARATTLTQYYIFQANFYLFKDSAYHPIRTKHGLLKLLHPHKKELKRFISSHNWRYRLDAEELIRQTVREYEKIVGL